MAGDSTKLRAQNSKKNNFNERKIERHLQYIDRKLDEYNKALAEADDDNKQIIEQEIKKYSERKYFFSPSFLSIHRSRTSRSLLRQELENHLNYLTGYYS